MKFIRITADDDQAVQELVQDQQALVCKEGPDSEKNCRKTHYHMLLDSDLSDNGLRKQIYKYFKVSEEDKGQKTCAFTQVKDVEGCKRYICKGLENVKPEIIVNTMMINVDRYYHDYWDIFSSLKKQGQAEAKAAKSRTIEFYDYFDSNYTGEANRLSRQKLSQAKVCNIMCRWFQEQGYTMPTKWQGQQIVITCYARYSEQSVKEDNLLKYYGFHQDQEWNW